MSRGFGEFLYFEPKLVGTAKISVHIEECYVSGRRKYNRGRMMTGNRHEREEEVVKELPDWSQGPPVEYIDPPNTDEDSQSERCFEIDAPEWQLVYGMSQDCGRFRFIFYLSHSTIR